MGLTRSTKILILLAIDVTFFLVELIAGYSVGSLALVADSFHMLNDVMSLLISYYAIKLAAGEASSKYSYGWHRAEIVAALINGVFLLALCFSIFMEAIERFFSTPEISNPKLVVIVGSFGLASNVLGLFLFHEHGHSHGHSHDERPAKPAVSAKVASGERTPLLEDSSSSSSSSYSSPRVRSGSLASIYGHPAQTRAFVVQTAQDIAGRATSPPPRNRKYAGLSQSAPNPARHSIEGLLQGHAEPGNTPSEVQSPTEERREEHFTQASHSHSHSHDHSPDHDSDLESGHSGSDHGHSHSRGGGAHGHSHGSMNMHALILHVIGDALGNVGVIATGLIIWLSTWSFKYYCDPIISLVITVIIFSSALPLVRSASFILLQGVPPCVSLEEIRKDILALDGVLSIHEFHIWQLSESKIVASVHVWVAPDREYMKVARQVRHILHDHGVHSSTVQPEVYPQTSLLDEHRNGSNSCLVPCPPGAICGPDNACCPPPAINGKPNGTT